MDFGKVPLEHLDKIDFRFSEAPETFFIPCQAIENQTRLPLKVWVGCPVWANKAWVGKIYPKGTKEKDFLTFYSRQFNTIELNTSHYRIPDRATIKQWCEKTPETFVFCPKILQTISHKFLLEGNFEAQTMLFCQNIQLLGKRLGACFLQLPPYFEYRHLELLEKFIAFFPTEIPLSIEFRHESWFKENHFEQTVQLLQAYQKGTVITDVAGRRDVLHLRCSTPTAMIRFVGNDLHPTDYQRIDAWVQRLQQWYERGLQAVYFFIHEPDDNLSPVLAHYFIRQINQKLALNLPPIQFYDTPKPQIQQIRLF
ncbi:MAG: DUF72 domain-containing protein [Microscillaceae bacterium]|nr:DUF72 domain-containing protein [Microscillaceae bacterium]MDW8459583.1 DUF72 domain-containing protein [Cytophagales bacterium]